jgi:hypothetical protein
LTILNREDACLRRIPHKGYQGIDRFRIDLPATAIGAKGDELIQGLFEIIGNERRFGGRQRRRPKQHEHQNEKTQRYTTTRPPNGAA